MFIKVKEEPARDSQALPKTTALPSGKNAAPGRGFVVVVMGM
jgi:hypothetical protein